jgi:transcriptional regulator with XRE-family HTH domain
MTKEQKLKMYEMRLDGYTIQEIADEFGVSRQYVVQIVPFNGRSRKGSSYDKCIYPNIKNWLIKNRIAYRQFADLCDVNVMTLHNGINGNTTMTKTTIDKILKATGMKYEEAFMEDKP